MHEELEQIANLRFGKAMETIASETRQNLQDAANRFAATAPAGVRSGQHQASLIRLRVDGAERIARALFQIWVDLIVKKNSHITRPDIDFIASKIEHFANAQAANIRRASAEQHAGIGNAIGEETNQRMHALCTSVRRDLEIMAREYEVFPVKHQEVNSVANAPKKRYSLGRQVLVGMGMRPGVIKSIDDKPSVMGEYAHVVVFDDNGEERRVLGCDIHPIPEFDQDLRSSGTAIHIHNSNVGNINLGSQIGYIEVVLEQISAGDESEKEVARALREFMEAVVAASMSDSEKQELVEALSTVAEQAAKKPEERSKGTLKAVVAWIPHAVATAAHLTALWDKFGPIIKAYFHL